MSSGMGRRDTPAARAALARRRQRVAQSMTPQSSSLTVPIQVAPTGARASSIPSRVSTNNTNTTTNNPSTSRSSGPSVQFHRPQPKQQQHHRSLPSQSQSQSQSQRMQPLRVDTAPARLSSSNNNSNNINNSNSRMSPLARRAMEINKSPTHAPSVMDATHTTVAMTTATRSTAPSVPTSVPSLASPEKHGQRIKPKPRSPLSQYVTTTAVNNPSSRGIGSTTSPNRSQLRQPQPQQGLYRDQPIPASVSATNKTPSFRQSPFRASRPTTMPSPIPTPTPTPQQALNQSQQAADHATSILNAVQARSMYRSASPRAVPTLPSTVSTPTRHPQPQSTATPTPTHQPITFTSRMSPSPTPSRLAQQEDLLAASKRRRQTFENRFHTALGTQPMSVDTGPPPLPTQDTPAAAHPRRSRSPERRLAVNTSVNAAGQATLVARPEPTTVESLSQSLRQSPKKGTIQPSTATATATTPTRTSPATVIPRRNPSPARRNSPLKVLSPSRFQLSSSPATTPVPVPAPAPAQTPANTLQSPRMAEYLQPSSSPPTSQPQPSPAKPSIPMTHRRPKTPQQASIPKPQYSPGAVRIQNLPRGLTRRSRSPSPRRLHPPPPTDSNIRRRSPGTGSSLQNRAMQMVRSKSPSFGRSYNENAAYQSPRASNPASNGRLSPGVERLSDFLMDSSFNDVSTIADMTHHQMETPKNAANLSFSAFSHRKPTAPSNGHSPYPTAIEFDESQATLDPGKLQSIDSACLQTGSTITLRAYSQPLTVGIDPPTAQVAKTTQAPKYRLAKLTGAGLGHEDEVLTLKKVPARDGDPSSLEIRYGDAVLLFSAAAGNRALGTRKFVNTSGNVSKMELGFFAGVEGPAEMWTLLKARPDKEILVGRAAVAAEKDSQHTRSSDGSGAVPKLLRSGDPVLLRNTHNGGILSMDQTGHLVLLTDSYEHRDSQGDPTLMGRLMTHDRLHPQPRETFQLILAASPPCPPWIARQSPDERIFLTGSYLVQPRRNEARPEVNSRIFANQAPFPPALAAAETYVMSDDSLPAKTKERILMDEVLGSFLGLEGLHIRLKSARGNGGTDHFEFQLLDGDGTTFDVGLRHLVEQMLPLSTSYVRVRNFVSSRYPGYEYGQVLQAFAEALDELLQEYIDFVSGLERKLRSYSKTDVLTMKSIYFEVTSSLHTMSILEHAASAVCDTKGGDFINALSSLDKRSYMGDTAAKRVLGILLERASAPYMNMMTAWLQTGRLQDPYEEFMILQSEKLGGRTRFDGDTWLGLFQVQSKNVIEHIIPNDWTEKKVLTTGKYWNAVQECHTEAREVMALSNKTQGSFPQLSIYTDSSGIASYIDTMYQSASKALVRTMMEKFKLMESLQVMKRYFLMDQGDFLMHFLDAAEMELLKPEGEVSMGRIQHALSTSIHLTEVQREDMDLVSGLEPTSPLKPSNLRSRFAEDSLVDYLDKLYGGGIAQQGPSTPSRHAYGRSAKGNSGIEVFSIDFPKVPFPISLVLSQKAMENYKLLFRHLFLTKHVERRLIGVWRDHQLLKKLDALRGLLGPTFLLRQRMLHFVQNLMYYMVYEVVEGHWSEMQEAIGKTSEYTPRATPGKQQTVDDILKVHNDFLKRTLEACLLTNRDLVRSLTKVMNTCLLFTDQMKRFMDTTKIYDDSINLAAEKRGVVQRNLNERGTTQNAMDRPALRRAMASTKEERKTMNNRQTRRVGREVNSESYQRMINRFNEVFDQDLTDFMVQLNANTTSGIVANLGIRLDYNGFLSSTISKAAKKR